MTSDEKVPHHPADPTRVSPVGQTAQERGYLRAIERRIDGLQRRIARRKLGGEPVSHWDAHEANALKWALARIADIEREESA